MALEDRPASFGSSSLAQKFVVSGLALDGMIEASWRRCTERYRMQADAKQRVASLTSYEFSEHREPFDGILEMIAEELEYVTAPLSSAGFGASFSNMAGTILCYRSDRSAGNYVDAEREGTLWAEGITGTNGVGTCVVERRPAQVFKAQHFFRDFAHMSCTAVPVLDADSEMLGVLNFCSANPQLEQETFRLVTALAGQTAGRLNNNLFRLKYSRESILRARCDAGSMLLALDGDNRIIGANGLARIWLGLDGGVLRPTALDAHFTFERRVELPPEGGVIMMRRAGNNAAFKVVRNAAKGTAVLTPPTAKTSVDTQPAAPTVEDCLGDNSRNYALATTLNRVCASGLPVLLLGETGTGKDTLARALHLQSARRDKPLVAFNCASIPETMIDSELFGYASGAFTGAKRDGNLGRLVEADGGTLFLDELGDMPLVLQTRLLRVLETGEVSPLGAGKTRVIDVQVIAATNCDLPAQVAAGRFRADLYHRLAGMVIELTALRDRTDLQRLVAAIIARVSGGRTITVSQAALARLRAYHWPGNIRQLQHVLRLAVAICDGEYIQPNDLILDAGKVAGDLASQGGLGPAKVSIHSAAMAAERAAIAGCLAENNGNVMISARQLNVSRATLYRKIKQFGLNS